MNATAIRAFALASALTLSLAACIPGQKMSAKGGQSEVVGGVEIPVQTITADMVSGKRQPVVLPAELTSFQPESYVVSPRVMNRAISIPAALVLIGALVGGTLAGVIGVLVALPIMASILLIIREVVVPKQDRKVVPEPRP